VRHLRGWLVAWVALFWLWLLFSGDWNRIELIAAACAATIGATIAEVARTAAGVRAAVPLKVARSVPRAVLQVLPDFGYLVWALALSVSRREVVRGRTIRRAFHAVGDDPSAVGERVIVLWAANFSPNAIAIDIDRDHEQSIVHDLIPNRASERPA
jgi:multisubunit Na+/H+ antiporter MnhE subunit